MNQKDAQFRSAKSIVTTDRWLAGGKTEAADVGLILLEKPFTGVKPIKFENTPNAGKAIIGIVGYPADKSLNGESGAQMVSQITTNFVGAGTGVSHIICTLTLFSIVRSLQTN